jgi:hypothetical protein
MKLYVCYGTFGGDAHACTRALNALRAAGHDPEVVRAYGAGRLPDALLNWTPGRRRAKELTGSSMVPVLELGPVESSAARVRMSNVRRRASPGSPPRRPG